MRGSTKADTVTVRRDWYNGRVEPMRLYAHWMKELTCFVESAKLELQVADTVVLVCALLLVRVDEVFKLCEKAVSA
jgi:hypothetical protein